MGFAKSETEQLYATLSGCIPFYGLCRFRAVEHIMTSSPCGGELVMVLFNNGYPARIHIIGSVGSGKTTLAKTLSVKLNVPHYELDNVVRKRSKSGDIRRSDEERDEYLAEIVNSDTWIIEGAHHKWVLEGFQKADLIIFLDVGYHKRVVRIVKRFILQKLGMEKSNYRPTIRMFKMMFVWNASFERESKPEILSILRQYQDKLLVLKDNTQVELVGHFD